MALPTSASAGVFKQQSVTTSVALDTIPAQATYALITVEGNGIRWRDDGTAPTAAIGMPVAAGATLQYNGPLAAFRMISQTGTATVNVSYYAARKP